MITIAVDDRLSIAQQIRDMMAEIDPEGSHYAGSDPHEVQKLAAEIRPDLIWLGIEMPGTNGLAMAADIKSVLPDANIVFVTACSQDASDAFGKHDSGFILKPLSKENLIDEIANLRNPVKPHGSVKTPLQIQCFGNFDVFGKDGIVRFSRSLSKEAFAYLIDRRGAGCTVAEICSILWEDRTTDKGLKSQCRVVLGSLKKDLERAGAGDVIVKSWNTWSIDTGKVDCDYYRFLKSDSEAVNSFRGEYMAQYSWAEMTVGRLFDITENA